MADTNTQSTNIAQERHSGSDIEKHPEKTSNGDDAVVETKLKWTFHRAIAIASLCLVYVGAQEILYFVGGALNFIGYDTNTQFPNWLLTANTLAVTAVCPFVGFLTDLLGRKWITIFGAVLLVVSSVLMGVTQNFATSIVAMALGGVGAGICELTALAGVAEITPVKWRGVTLSIVTFSIVPFMPYLLYILEFQRHSSWRYVFAIAGAWNFIGLLGLIFCYKPPPRHNVDNLSTGQILSQIDWVGAFLSIAGVTLFLVGLQAGGYQYAWTDGRAIGPLIVGIVLIIVFPIWELYGAKHPMVPKEIFQGQRVVALAYLIVFIAGMFFYSILGFFPVLLTTIYEPDPILAGVRALCYPIAILSGACIVSFLMSYTKGHVRWMFVGCSVLMTAFGGALAASNPFNPQLAVTFATFAAFGVGGVIVPALTLALYAAPDRYIGTVAALSLTVRFLGGSIGTTIYYNIFNNNITAKLPAYIAQAVIGAGLPETDVMQFIVAITNPVNGAAMLMEVPNITPEIVQAGAVALRWAFSDSMQYVWYATIPFGVISIICSAFVPNIRQYMTGRVAVDLH